MKNTPLIEKHLALGARMSPFAGFNMPISYSGIKDEHQCVRNGVGVFDVSHMGEFIVKGKEALALVQRVSSNDASKLQIGQVQYACLPNTEGGIVDDLLVYRLPENYCSEGEQAFMLVVNASNIEKDWNWINQFAPEYDTRLINISDETALLAVQGPKATEVLQKLTDVDLASIKYYNFQKGVFAGFENILISATGYTGAGGFEIYAKADQITAIWDAIFEAGKDAGIKPIGLGARDTLRLEMGFCLYGNDIDDTTSPIEAGLGWITKTKKGDFVSVETFKRQLTEGVSRKLVGFMLQDRRIPRHGHIILNEAGEQIGVVTSGSQSITLDKPIGMGYLQKPYDALGTTIYIDFNGKKMADRKSVV